MKTLVVGMIVMLFIGCEPESVTMSTKPFKDKGTIKESANVFTIHADGGRIFVPVNMSNEFRINNLRVEFEGIVEIDKSLPPNLEAIRLNTIRKI